MTSIPTVIIGGTGYVAGELLRLVLDHPHLDLTAVASQSQAGKPISDVFPHLASALKAKQYASRDELSDYLKDRVAVFSAAPHGASADMLAGIIATAKTNQCAINIVDASADFRFTTASAWEAVYTQSHGAPELIEDFGTGLPEHTRSSTNDHIGHPGCFATAMLLGCVPLLDLELVEPSLSAFGVTGSTGSGRSPIATTHHPYRHANFYAYKPLHHRHAAEVIEMCATKTGVTPVLNFVPHSGPFARGIHMTLQATLRDSISEVEIRKKLREYYVDDPFLTIVDGTPRIKDVVGSNYAHIGVATQGKTLVVFCAIDNLLKGAAGGAVQWMNLLQGWDESTGLTAASPGWL